MSNSPPKPPGCNPSRTTPSSGRHAARHAVESLRDLSISYRERIELLKPILGALKEKNLQPKPVNSNQPSVLGYTVDKRSANTSASSVTCTISAEHAPINNGAELSVVND